MIKTVIIIYLICSLSIPVYAQNKLYISNGQVGASNVWVYVGKLYDDKYVAVFWFNEAIVSFTVKG